MGNQGRLFGQDSDDIGAEEKLWRTLILEQLASRGPLTLEQLERIAGRKPNWREGDPAGAALFGLLSERRIRMASGRYPVVLELL